MHNNINNQNKDNKSKQSITNFQQQLKDVEMQQKVENYDYLKHLKWIIPVGALGLGIAYACYRYKISLPNQYIVKTGLGIQDMVIAKNTLQLPFQQVAYIDMTPKSYQFTLQAMSKEKMEFILPCVFTIGPKDDASYLQNYSRYLLFECEDKYSEIIRGMIEGETRVLAANMSIEDIFKGRTEFKTEIINQVQLEMQKLGLSVFNANIKELQDSNESKYFKFLSQKVSADAENQAKIDISEAQKIGSVGEKQREGEQRQKVVEIESQTTVFENQKQQEIAQSRAELCQKQSELSQVTKIAEIEAQKNAEKRSEELQRVVEETRLKREIEKERAERFSFAKVQAEVDKEQAIGKANSIKELADADLFQKQRDADATLYERQKQAAALKEMADADMYKEQRSADAMLYEKQKEAQGITDIYEAQADGLAKILGAFGNDTKAALSYMMIEQDVYTKLARENAQAINGLNPKISIWNTGSGDGQDKTYDTIHNIMRSIPPVVETIQDQTDIKFPEWMTKSGSDKAKLMENLSPEQIEKIKDQFLENKK